MSTPACVEGAGTKIPAGKVSDEEIAFRNVLTTFTIDRRIADFDDALSHPQIEKWLVGSRRARCNVTHYVTEGGRLVDKEAEKRATVSVYLVDRTMRMLPNLFGSYFPLRRQYIMLTGLGAIMDVNEAKEEIEQRMI